MLLVTARRKVEGQAIGEVVGVEGVGVARAVEVRCWVEVARTEVRCVLVDVVVRKRVRVVVDVDVCVDVAFTTWVVKTVVVEVLS